VFDVSMRGRGACGYSNLAQYEAYYTQLMSEVYSSSAPVNSYGLAALLSLLALGLELSCVDETVSQVAIAYHDLARGALCLHPGQDDVEIHLLMSLVRAVAQSGYPLFTGSLVSIFRFSALLI